MKTITVSHLRGLVKDIFQTRGVSERDSGIVAECLVHANLRGTDSHGVMRVEHYIRRLDAGSINPTPVEKIDRTGPATAMVHGDDGLGHVSVWKAMHKAIEIAGETGVAFVGVRKSNHCGALSFYVHEAISQEMIGIAMTQTDKGVVPYGGRQPFLGTNPLCFGFPAATGVPVVLDMATSTVAGGHIYKARIENREIPADWAVDSEGNPTTDPHRAAYWTPAGGPKGSGLSIIVDILTGVLCGGTFSALVPIMYGNYDQKRDLCHLVAAVDYRRFAGRASFRKLVSQLVEDLHRIPPADGFDRVLAPGEREYLCEAERKERGIPVEDSIYEGLCKLKSPVSTS